MSVEVSARAEEFDWPGVRRDFPATAELAYLNSAATGPVLRQAAEAAGEFYRDAQAAGDARWFDWLRRREEARSAVARLVNAEPDEIGFTTNTSQGMNLIADALEGRGEVVSCELEFPVSTIPWMHRGVNVHLLKPRDGKFDADDVLSAAGTRAGKGGKERGGRGEPPQG